MRLPGRWLRTAAARLCSQRTMDRVIDPIVADVQTEYADAIGGGRRWRAAWVRVGGYAAFWKAVVFLAVQSGPRSIWAGIAADGWTVGRVIGYSLIACLGLTLLLAVRPILDVGLRFGLRAAWLLLPQAIAVGIPMALPLGIALGVRGPRSSTPPISGALFVAGVATLLAFAAMLIIPVANQAFRMTVAQQLDARMTPHSLPRGPNERPCRSWRAARGNSTLTVVPKPPENDNRVYHLRFALPAATFVLSLLALGVCGTVRGRARRVGAIVVSIGLYWVILAGGEARATLSPFVSVWAPNLAFAAIALTLLNSHPRVTAGVS